VIETSFSVMTVFPAVANKMQVKIIAVQNVAVSVKQFLGYLLYMSSPLPVKVHRVTVKPNIYM